MIDSLKSAIKRVPLIGPALARLYQRPGLIEPAKPEPFTGSAGYWERRYNSGDNSGAGSYGRLAAFKAQVLNRFVKERRITSVIEFGCGDGAQLKLARYPKYTGVDVSLKAVEMCRRMFAEDHSKIFFQSGELPGDIRADLALSLDVIYHLVEDSVFETYMHQLFGAARRYAIVYSSDVDQTWPNEHVRHRCFTRWIAEHQTGWKLESVVKNRYPYDPADPERTSFADFHIYAQG